MGVILAEADRPDLTRSSLFDRLRSTAIHTLKSEISPEYWTLQIDQRAALWIDIDRKHETNKGRENELIGLMP